MANSGTPKLLVLLPPDPEHKARLEALAHGRCQVTWLDQDAPTESMSPALASADIVLGDPPPALLPVAKRLRLLQTTWAGVGQYLDTLPPGCTLCNMSGAYGVVIAEHMMAMVLALCRRFPAYLENMETGRWQDQGPEKALEDATVLVLGAGDIGSQFALRMAPFGVKLIGVRRTLREAAPPFGEMITLAELDRWLPQADIVACSLPGTHETAGLLNGGRLASMKEDAVLVNVGRGSLIDTDALVGQLQGGRLFGVGLDVTDPEPLPPDHPLWHCPRTLITPHVSGIGFGHLPQTARRIWSTCLDNLERCLDGKPLQNVVDPRKGY